MNPVDVILSGGFWKFLSIVISVGTLLVTSILVAKGVVRKGVVNNRCNSVVHSVVNKKNKSKHAYKDTNRVNSNVKENDKTIEELAKMGKTTAERAPINAENYSNGKIVKSLSNPKLNAIVDEYAKTANLAREKNFTKVKINYSNDTNVKGEELTAPDSFVELVFIPKAIYECAINEKTEYPVVISYGDGKEVEGNDLQKTIRLESRESARSLAVDKLRQIDPNIVAKAQMDLGELIGGQTSGGVEK